MPSISVTNPEVITSIDLGNANPKLGGSINLSRFTSVKIFKGVNMDLTSFTLGTNNTNLEDLQLNDNLLEGSIPDLSSNTQLRNFTCLKNQLSGSIPNLSSNTNLKTFNCASNSLDGEIPDLSSNVELIDFQCYSQSIKLTGSIPDLSSNTLLVRFSCQLNNLSGSIPNLTYNTSLSIFNCFANDLDGGWDGGSFSSTLKTFRAQSNALQQIDVDGILAAFNAAGASNGLLNLGGTNASPTDGNNNSDRLDLVARGWSVIVSP